MLSAAKSFSIITAFLFSAGCTVYKSSDRKKFETDTAAVQINSFIEETCSDVSLRDEAQASKLVKIFNSSHDGGSVFLWEHIVNDKSYLETDNLKGVYCLYE
jgi:hypothetical protein